MVRHHDERSGRLDAGERLDGLPPHLASGGGLDADELGILRAVPVHAVEVFAELERRHGRFRKPQLRVGLVGAEQEAVSACELGQLLVGGGADEGDDLVLGRLEDRRLSDVRIGVGAAVPGEVVAAGPKG